jgi:hypothetical protein
MHGKIHTLAKHLCNLTSKTATINITKYIINIRSCSPIICQISDQFLKLVLQLLRKNISCSSSINKNDKSCFKWYISRYIFQYNCDRLCFSCFSSKFQENTILFVKSFLSKALKAIISSKLDE